MTKQKEKIWQDLSKMFIKHQKVDGIRMALQAEVADYIDKALQSYSQEMNKVIGEYEEPSEYKNFGIEPIASEQIRNILRQSQRQEKLEIDKKWGINDTI